MNKYKRASEQGRLALIPGWMQEGKTVFLWDSPTCQDEPCGDKGKLGCPLKLDDWDTNPVVLRCQRQHPVLRRLELWAIVARFTPRGVVYILNDYYVIPDFDLRRIVFRTEREARLNKPREAIF